MRSQTTCSVSLFSSVHTCNDSVTDVDICEVDCLGVPTEVKLDKIEFCKTNHYGKQQKSQLKLKIHCSKAFLQLLKLIHAQPDDEFELSKVSINILHILIIITHKFYNKNPQNLWLAFVCM